MKYEEMKSNLNLFSRRVFVEGRGERGLRTKGGGDLSGIYNLYVVGWVGR